LFLRPQYNRLPVKAKQWRCFYPASHHDNSRSSYALSFEQARTGFEAAWKCFILYRQRSLSKYANELGRFGPEFETG